MREKGLLQKSRLKKGPRKAPKTKGPRAKAPAIRRLLSQAIIPGESPANPRAVLQRSPKANPIRRAREKRSKSRRRAPPSAAPAESCNSSDQNLLGRRFAPKERKPGKRNAQKARKFILTSTATSSAPPQAARATELVATLQLQALQVRTKARAQGLIL
jgi:hypothetical protein